MFGRPYFYRAKDDALQQKAVGARVSDSIRPLDSDGLLFDFRDPLLRTRRSAAGSARRGTESTCRRPAFRIRGKKVHFK